MSAKKVVFDCPLRVVLTDDGLNSLRASNQQPQKIEIADRSLVYGMRFNRFPFPSLKKMVEQKYTHRIEMSVCRGATDPKDIVDLTQLFFFNWLYRKFDAVLFSYLQDSMLILAWKRLKTGIPLGIDTVIKERMVSEIAHRQGVDPDAVRQQLLKRVQASIVQSAGYSASEKNRYLLMSEKLLNSVRPVIWLCCALEPNRELVETFLSMVHELLIGFLQKSTLAALVGDGIQAILEERENQSMFYFAKRHHSTYTDDQILTDDALRRNLFVENSTSETQVSVCWEMDETASGDPQWSIFIYSAVDDFKKLLARLHEVQETHRNTALTDFSAEEPYLVLPILQRRAGENGISVAVELERTSKKDLSLLSFRFRFVSTG